MKRYFIERMDSGEWLANPESRGLTWTRDPYRAWVFDKIEYPQEELWTRMYREHERELFFGKQEDYYSWNLPVRTGGDEILKWLEEEKVMAGIVKMTEQVFEGDAYMIIAGDIQFVYNPMFDGRDEHRHMSWSYTPDK